MQVSNLLANKNQDVATISQERTVNDALLLLKERGIGALVVTGPDPAAGRHIQRARRGASPRDQWRRGARDEDLRVDVEATSRPVTRRRR